MKKLKDFFSKSSKIKIITTLYIIYIIIFAILIYFNPKLFNINITINDVSEGPITTIQIISGAIFTSLIYIFISITYNFFITAIYFGVLVSSIRHRKQKLEKVDYKNDVIYRDIIKEYSPGVLGFIDTFALSENHIIATVLELELKNKIKIEDVIKVIDEDESNLSNNEKYIFNGIKNNSYVNLNLGVFESKALDDSNKLNLIDIRKPISKTKKILTKLSPVLFYVLFLFLVNNRIIQVKNTFLIILLIILGIFMMFFPLISLVYYFFKTTLIKIDPYIRSEKGSEINSKLEGLKKYIKEFSILPEREQKEIKLWREYLIYSVMFDMNKKVVDEIKSKLNV